MTWIKKTYLYVVSLVSLIIMIVAAITLINLGLRIALHAENNISYPVCMTPAPANGQSAICDPAQQKQQQEYDQQNQSNQRKSDIAHSVAMFVVAAPVFLYHWKMAKREV